MFNVYCPDLNLNLTCWKPSRVRQRSDCSQACPSLRVYLTTEQRPDVRELSKQLQWRLDWKEGLCSWNIILPAMQVFWLGRYQAGSLQAASWLGTSFMSSTTLWFNSNSSLMLICTDFFSKLLSFCFSNLANENICFVNDFMYPIDLHKTWKHILP